MAKKFWENFILVAIILVIIQTFLDDFSRYMHWSVDVKIVLMISGFIFDLIFSIEFTVRSLLSRGKRGFRFYWTYERGWVDFLSSYPLLLLNSGPALVIFLTGHHQEGAAAIGIFNILKMVKAIRVTRILRLIRIIKIFGKIQNAESPMAQFHTSSISTIAVFTTITVLFVANIVFSNSLDKAAIERTEHYDNIIKGVELLPGYNKAVEQKYLSLVFKHDPLILKIQGEDGSILENISINDFKKYYSIEDYIKVSSKDQLFYISIVDINRDIAQTHLVIFFIIVFIVLAYMIIYTRMFVQNITDVIHVMFNGFKKRDYNLQVKINGNLDDHEVFKMAKFYNEYYLPAKLKKVEEERSKKSSLSMDDLMSFDK